MPVRVSIRGIDAEGAWCPDPLVVAERQRQGLGEALLRAWDRQSGVALGAQPSDGTRYLLDEDALAEAGAAAVPGQAAQPPRAAAARLAAADQPAGLGGDAAVRARRRARAAAARAGRSRPPVRSRAWIGCGSAWRRGSTSPVRRDARYLNWKYVEPPHVRYSMAVLQAQRRAARLRGLSPSARAAGPGHADRRLPRRSRRRARLEDAAALGRSRSAHGRLRQDPLLRAARPLPPRAAALGLFRREVERRC